MGNITGLSLTVYLFFGLQLVASVCAADPSPTLVPPSTFGTATGTATDSSSGASNTSTSSVSGGNSTASATPTNTADFPNLSSVSSCVSTCLNLGSAAANCTSIIDVNCYCVSGLYTSSFVNCVSAGCPSELSSAETLAQRFCDIATASTSLSFPEPTTTSVSSSSSSSTTRNSTTSAASTLSSSTPTARPTISSPPANGAKGTIFSLETSTVLGISIGVVGMLLGAYVFD